MIRDFSNLLAALNRKRKYSDHFKELTAQPGLRIIHLGGANWRGYAFFDRMSELIDQIFAQPPTDAVILDDDGVILRRVFQVAASGYGEHVDRFMIIVASREWPVVPESEMIPTLEITIRRRAEVELNEK